MCVGGDVTCFLKLIFYFSKGRTKILPVFPPNFNLDDEKVLALFVINY